MPSLKSGERNETMLLSSFVGHIIQFGLVIHGGGGVIAMDSKGNIGISYTENGMYRGYVGDDGKIVVKIYDVY